MAVAPPPGLPTFPAPEGYARALFEEALRHLEDARVLHHAARYPASLSSSMKAAELAVKSVLVLDGALGWWERLHLTHSPVTDITNHTLLRRHYDLLESYRAGLPGDVIQLEAFAPERPGAARFVAGVAGAGIARVETNPEYPFIEAGVDPATRAPIARLHRPTTFFGEPESRRCFGIARDLISALQSVYAEVAAWSLAAPGAL